MVSLQRRIDGNLGEEQERKFYSITLQNIKMHSTSNIEYKSWMITSFDVELGLQIGVGGL
jgi:hypothetical protein